MHFRFLATLPVALTGLTDIRARAAVIDRDLPNPSRRYFAAYTTAPTGAGRTDVDTAGIDDLAAGELAGECQYRGDGGQEEG